VSGVAWRAIDDVARDLQPPGGGGDNACGVPLFSDATYLFAGFAAITLPANLAGVVLEVVGAVGRMDAGRASS
jgi:hypothetical protein